MSEERYLLALYDDSDYELVDDIFLELYKKGIPVKSLKDNYIGGSEALLSDSTAVLFVISKTSLASRNMNHYIQLAEQFNKHIIPYYLEDPTDEISIPSSLHMKMDGSATIPAYEYAVKSALAQRTLSELKPFFPEAFQPKTKVKKGSTPTIFGTILLCFAVVIAYFFWFKPANTEKVLTHVKQSTVIIYATDETADNVSSGSGFFIDSYGTIATNYHVVDGAFHLLVQPFGEEDFFVASVISVDKANDLAIIQIDGSYPVIDYLTFATQKARIGENIYVSGYPRGIDLIISNGIVSNNEHYSLDDATEFYMITAAISPGNSGGPVVNESGKVIGIATAKYKDAENVNLARPVIYLKNLIEQK